MSLYHIAAEYNDNGPLEKRLMRIVTTIDAIWLNLVQLASPYCWVYSLCVFSLQDAVVHLDDRNGQGA